MRRLCFGILAGASLLLSLIGAVAWVVSYWKPTTLNVYTRSGDPNVGADPSEVTAKAFVENRRGRLVWLSQWVDLNERKRGDWIFTADCTLPRILLVFAEREGDDSLPLFANRYIHDPVVEPRGLHQRDTRWRRAGVALDWLDSGPEPVDAGALSRASSRPRDAGLIWGVPEGLGVLPENFAGYRQVMIPSWLPVLLGLSLPLLWLYANRRSRRWARQGRCVGCGYDLRESPERCPECGRVVPT